MRKRTLPIWASVIGTLGCLFGPPAQIARARGQLELATHAHQREGADVSVARAPGVRCARHLCGLRHICRLRPRALRDHRRRARDLPLLPRGRAPLLPALRGVARAGCRRPRRSRSPLAQLVAAARGTAEPDGPGGVPAQPLASDPRVPGGSDQARAANRRVEIAIVESKVITNGPPTEPN